MIKSAVTLENADLNANYGKLMACLVTELAIKKMGVEESKELGKIVSKCFFMTLQWEGVVAIPEDEEAGAMRHAVTMLQPMADTANDNLLSQIIQREMDAEMDAQFGPDVPIH